MSFEELSPEFKEKARACKSKEELVELAESMGVHLSDDELGSVAGGVCKKDCPWDGAICRIDAQCITKTDCAIKDACPDFFSCIPKYCKNFTDPLIQECKEFVFGDE